MNTPGRRPKRAEGPATIGYCPALLVGPDGAVSFCGRRVTDLSRSPWQNPHLVSAVPCGCWLTPEVAEELGRDEWARD